MSLPLRGRLALTHALLVLVVLGVAILLGARAQRLWVVRQSEGALERAARHAAGGLSPAGNRADEAARLGALTGYRVTLVDSAGRVLGDTDVPPGRLPQVENHASRAEVRAALAGKVGRGLRHSRTIGADLVYVALPVRAGDVRVLRLAEPLVAVRALQGDLLRTTALAALLALLISVPLVAWVAGRETRRTRELESVARRLGAGERGARARETPDDELGRLGRALNEMAGEAHARLEALEREREEREQILAHLSDGVALIGADDRVLRMNRSFADLVGAPLPAAPGTVLAEYARSDELDALVRAARAADRSLEGELRPRAPDGRGPVHATATPLLGPSRGTLLLVLHDLAEAERLTRMRQEFVANVSHELRTPLTSLRGYAETLLDGGLEDPENRERFVRVILEQAVRLEAITRDLLTLAGLERTGVGIQPVPLDLREVAERQVATLRPDARRAGLELALEPGAPVPMRGDRRMLEQMIANLLDNAIKYTERGSVRVRLGLVDDRVWLEVEDSGSGIPESALPRVFERFYRVDKARSREKGGTGLGLAIVKHIAVLHGGEVSVRSRVDEGSRFRFEGPAGPPVG